MIILGTLVRPQTYELKAPESRLKYIRILDIGGIKVEGEWPEGKLQNKHDEASILLAQMEERWLGLDRQLQFNHIIQSTVCKIKIISA